MGGVKTSGYIGACTAPLSGTYLRVDMEDVLVMPKGEMGPCRETAVRFVKAMLSLVTAPTLLSGLAAKNNSGKNNLVGVRAKPTGKVSPNHGPLRFPVQAKDLFRDRAKSPRE